MDKQSCSLLTEYFVFFLHLSSFEELSSLYLRSEFQLRIDDSERAYNLPSAGRRSRWSLGELFRSLHRWSPQISRSQRQSSWWFKFLLASRLGLEGQQGGFGRRRRSLPCRGVPTPCRDPRPKFWNLQTLFIRVYNINTALARAEFKVRPSYLIGRAVFPLIYCSWCRRVPAPCRCARHPPACWHPCRRRRADQRAAECHTVPECEDTTRQPTKGRRHHPRWVFLHLWELLK